jgi:transposase
METRAIKTLDFTRKSIYIGLDVHLKSWSVSLYSEEFELKTFSQPPKADLLGNYLQKHYPGAKFKAVYEAGFSGFSIQRQLSSIGIECQVIHPADVPSSDKEKRHKTDKIDSRKLAKSIRNNELKGIYIPSVEMQEDRNLLRARLKIVRDKTRVKNRIKSYLKFQGVNQLEFEERKWGKKYIASLKTMNFATKSASFAFQAYLNELEFLERQEKILDQQIKELSKTEPYLENVRLLLSVPSIGLTSAMILLTEIGDMLRFKRLDDLCSFFGLIPNSHSSGEKDRVGHITARGNQFLKSIIIECAWVAMRKDPALLQCYKELLIRMDANKAIIRIAKRLLSRIRHVILNKEKYQLGILQ